MNTSAGYEDRLRSYSERVSAQYVDFLKRHEMAFRVSGAKGALVFDELGNEYIDCIAGYGNLGVGHNHDAVIEAVLQEIQSPQPFNWPFIGESHAQLADRLAQIAPGNLSKCLVVNSGSEAVDSALKLVRLATGKPHVIAMRGGWHGFTFGALSVSEPSLCGSFRPLLDGVTHVPYGDIAALIGAANDQTGAVILEPIQAESGARMPPPGYLEEAAEYCRNNGIALIVDEAKTGLGKTGRLFACDHDGVEPDILILGKALGGGLMPIGVVMARKGYWAKFGYSFPMSSSSAAGNAPACAAALATLRVIEEEGLCENAERIGARILSSLKAVAGRDGSVARSVDGRGLLIGLQIDSARNASKIVAQCAREGLLVMTAFCDRSRILVEPPLCISSAQADAAVSILSSVINRVSGRA